MNEIKKRTSIIVIAIIFATALSGLAYAKTLKCTVNTVKDGIVTLDCGKHADIIKPGQRVKIRPETKRKAVEGC
jgi:hypothetical protein